MTIDVVNASGKKVESITLPKELFGVEVKTEVLSQALRVYTDRQHQGSKKTLTRGEVNRTTAKVWRQKGTGRARHGSRKAPIFVGGGIAFGPQPKTGDKLTLNKKTKKLALVGALSLQAKNKNIIVLDGVSGFDGKTKTAENIFSTIASYQKNTQPQTLLVLASADNNCIRSCRNLPGITVSQAKRINLYEVLSSQKIIIVKDSLSTMKDTYTVKTS